MKVFSNHEESNGLKKRGKNKKKRVSKEGLSINLHKRSRRQEFSTRDPNEEREDTGPQLLLEDRFSDNTFEKVIKEQLCSIRENPHHYDPALPKPTVEYTDLLANMLNSMEEVKNIIATANKNIQAYNHKLAQAYQQQSDDPRNSGKPLKLLLEPKPSSARPGLGLEDKEACEKEEADGVEESLESQVLERTLYQQAKIEQDLKDSYSYINCDVRYFNFEYLTSKLGQFEVLLVDPPWRIKGGQKNDSQYMFSNSSFCLEYNTMSNSEIMNLPLEKLSNKGFIFLWILANQIDSSVNILEKWGYALVDLIMWVKIKDKKIWLSHGYYLMHSYEVCLVGYKCPPKEHVEFFSKVSNNIIFAEVRSKSQKPDELYELIELMMPGSKKVEIFARNNNVRPGWFAIGNQLGPQFGKWKNLVHCDRCSKPLDASSKCRYKSKKTPNYDLCTDCFAKDSQLLAEAFFKLNTAIQEDILHYYRTCNLCKTEPIWGVRFTRKDEPDFDLCEGRRSSSSMLRLGPEQQPGRLSRPQVRFRSHRDPRTGRRPTDSQEEVPLR